MRIAFIGAVDFSEHCLREVIRAGGTIIGVVTLAPEHATFNADYADLTAVAEPAGIAVVRVDPADSTAVERVVREWVPDVIFVFGWSRLLSAEVLALPRLGCIGSHPALLPRNRGRHPLIWALVEGLRESGLTFFYMDTGADSGDILWQDRFDISLDDDAETLYWKVKNLASRAIAEFVPQLMAGIAPRRPQDHAQATYWRKRGKKDGEIDWAAPTLTIYNLIRALTRPYIGAHTIWNGREVKIWRSRLPTPPIIPPLSPLLAAVAPGTVMARTAEGWQVRTGDGWLWITEIAPEFSAAINANDQFEPKNP